MNNGTPTHTEWHNTRNRMASEFDRRRFRYHAGPSTFTTPPSYNPGPHEWVLESQATPAPPPAEPKDKWVPYVDPLSDQVYWINEKLNQQ